MSIGTLARSVSAASAALLISASVWASSPIAADSGSHDGRPNIPSPRMGASSFDSIGALKKSSTGAPAVLNLGVVTATAEQMGGFLYVEDPSRAAGIRVNTSDVRQVGDRVSIQGTLATTACGELQLAGATTALLSHSEPLPPLGVPARALGGASFGLQESTSGDCGLNNVGLLVRTMGKVTNIGSGYLYIDDGSGPKDGTSTRGDENEGVRVVCDTSGCAVNDFVQVTGISSCFNTGSRLAPSVLVRTSGDVVPHRLSTTVCASLGEVKKAGVFVRVQLADVVVTATAQQMANCIYVENPLRFSGVRVASTTTLELGDRVSVTGIVGKTPDDEVEIQDATVGFVSHGEPLSPVGMSVVRVGGGALGAQGAVLGGSGVNNIGLLVRVWGYVIEKEPVAPPQTPSWVKVDDGSAFTAKVMLPSGVAAPGLGAFVQITGISSCEKVAGDLLRVVRVRR